MVAAAPHSPKDPDLISPFPAAPRRAIAAPILSCLFATMLTACGGGISPADASAADVHPVNAPAASSGNAPVATAPVTPAIAPPATLPAVPPATPTPPVIPPPPLADLVPPANLPKGIGTATVTWVAPATRANGDVVGGLMGFRAYYGTVSGAYTASVYVAGATASSATVTGLGAGTWYFTVTSIDALGNESSIGYEMSKSL